MTKLPRSLIFPITILLANEFSVTAAFSAPSARLVPPRSIRSPANVWDNVALRHTHHYDRHGHGVRGLSIVSSAASEEAGEDDASSNKIDDKIIEGRKRRVVAGYKAMVASYFAVGAASIAKAGVIFPVARMLATFIAMPAGLSYIMISAAKNDRLGSDTYKRLNAALVLNGALGLATVALGFRQRSNIIYALASALSVINSTKGYAYGVLGWDKSTSGATLLDDLKGMISGMIEGFLLSVPKNGKAFVYHAATVMISSLKLLKLFEIIKYIQSNSFTAGLAPLLARFNRLLLFSLVLYTLKDAADRDRLGGTTFIQLNYLSTLSMGFNSAFYSGCIPEVVGALSATFAAFFAFTGVNSYMKKNG